MIDAARAFVRRFRGSVFPDTVEAMRRNRERVPEKLRVPRAVAKPVRFLARRRRGEVRLSNLTVITHHFMSRAELATPLGQERIATCVFHVPIGDRLVPMCEVNATDPRDRYHADVAEGRAPGRGLPVLYPLRAGGKPVRTHAS